MSNVTLTIHLDGVESQNIEIEADALPKLITIPLDGVEQLKIIMNTNSYANNVHYGFANPIIR